MKTAITTSHAPAAIGPYSQAHRLWRPGLHLRPAADRSGHRQADSRPRSPTGPGRCCATSRPSPGAGGDLAGIAKTTIFLTDLADFQAVNRAYGEFFPTAPPARSTVQVVALPLGSNIEIEAVLQLPS